MSLAEANNQRWAVMFVDVAKNFRLISSTVGHGLAGFSVS